MPLSEKVDEVLLKNCMMIYTQKQVNSKTILVIRENLTVNLSPMRASQPSDKSMSLMNQRGLREICRIMEWSSMSKTLCTNSIRPSTTMLEKSLNISNDKQAFDSSKIGNIWRMVPQARAPT